MPWFVAELIDGRNYLLEAESRRVAHMMARLDRDDSETVGIRNATAEDLEWAVLASDEEEETQ